MGDVGFDMPVIEMWYFYYNKTIFEALNVYFAALKAATKGSPWMGPSFAWTDQDPSGPWTRCSTRPCLPLQTRETVRQANGLRNVDWTFGKFLLLYEQYNLHQCPQITFFCCENRKLPLDFEYTPGPILALGTPSRGPIKTFIALKPTERRPKCLFRSKAGWRTTARR